MSSEVRKKKKIKKPTFLVYLQTAPYITKTNWCSHPRAESWLRSQLRAAVQRETGSTGRLWSCHCLLDHGERVGCAQLPWDPKRAIGLFTCQVSCSRSVGHKGEKPIQQGSWGVAAPSPCPTAASSLRVPSLGDALPQHPHPMLNTARHQKAFLIASLHHFCCTGSLLLDVLPIFALSSHQHDTETCWRSSPIFTFLSSSVPFLQNLCLFLILCALIIPAQEHCTCL